MSKFGWLLHQILNEPLAAAAAAAAMPSSGASGEALISDRRSWFAKVLSDVQDNNMFHAALLGGFRADTMGTAFFAGYQAAMRFGFPNQLKESEIGAICVTEKKGNTPSAMSTCFSYSDMMLNGHKSFSLAVADVVFVFARDSRANDKAGSMKIIKLPAAMTTNTSPNIPQKFIPDVPHCERTFINVHLKPEWILPGDGYLDYVKKFRTNEDIHVMAALIGHHLHLARRKQWSSNVIEKLVGCASGLECITAMPLMAPVTHIALAGVIQMIQRTIIDDCKKEWSEKDSEERSNWETDLILLNIASGIRKIRDKKAWESLSKL